MPQFPDVGGREKSFAAKREVRKQVHEGYSGVAPAVGVGAEKEIFGSIQPPFCALQYSNDLQWLERDRKEQEVKNYEQRSQVCSVTTQRKCSEQILERKT